MKGFTLVAALIAAAALAPLASAHVDNPDFEFWLSSDSPNSGCSNVMYEADATHNGLDVAIPNSDSRTFASDQAALAALPVGGAGQVFTLTLLVKQGANMIVEFGYCEADGSFTACEGSAVSQGVAGPVVLPQPVTTITARNVNVVFQPDASCIVPAGAFLALQITASGNDVVIGTSDLVPPLLPAKERSHLHTNMPAPNYPVPELPTMLLAGVGLGAVALVVARRK